MRNAFVKIIKTNLKALGRKNLCGPAMDIVLAVIHPAYLSGFKAFASFSLKRREDPKLNSNLLRIPVPQKYASSVLLINRVSCVGSQPKLIIRIVFLVVLTINNFQTTAQVDSLHKVFRGIDVGITVTPNLYQKQKVIVYTGNDYLTPRFKFGFEGGIILTKNFGKGKFGVSTWLIYGMFAVEENFFVPQEDLIINFPEDLDTYWNSYWLTLDYLKVPVSFTFRKPIKNKVGMIQIGGSFKYHETSSITSFGTGVSFNNYLNGRRYVVFYNEFVAPDHHFTFDSFVKIGFQLTISKRLLFTPSIYYNLSFSKFINGDYRFTGIVPSGTGNIIVRQDFIGLSLDLMYKGKNR